MTIPPMNLKTGNELAQQIRMGKSIQLKCVKLWDVTMVSSDSGTYLVAIYRDHVFHLPGHKYDEYPNMMSWLLIFRTSRYF